MYQNKVTYQGTSKQYMMSTRCAEVHILENMCIIHLTMADGDDAAATATGNGGWSGDSEFGVAAADPAVAAGWRWQ